jgi:two-component system, cell cycle sensor histidine kinase and response regulator CckA
MTDSDPGNFETSAYRQFFEAASDALFIHAMDGRILLVNDRTCAMYGYTREAILKLSVGELSTNEPPYSQADAAAGIAAAAAGEEPRFEWRSRRASGEIFWTEVALRRLELEGRVHVMACVRDIDARKRMEAALRESEERFATIFNATSTMLAFTERQQGRIIDVNEAWLKAMGLSRPGAIGKTGRELGLWANAEDRQRILDELEAQGRVEDAEVELVMGGRRFPARLAVRHVDMRGERYILWEVGDLTERKRAEREQELLHSQFIQAQKMESIGRLAGGMAHDFNNIILAILGFGELARDDLPAATPAAEYVSEMISGAQRGADLIKQLLAFSRKQVMQPKVVDPGSVMSGLLPLLQRLLGEDVIVELALAPGTSPIRVDVGQLEQVIMNLAVNARDAMPDGGTLTLETANVEFDGPYVATHADTVAGAHVMIAVSDTGVGMDADTRARAFEPFFTTKESGKGTGLGLSTVYGIVKQSGGWIWLYSEPGKGTTVKLYFPKSPEAVESSGPPLLRPASPRPGTVVLLVEDDEQVRRLVATVLRRAGYTVLVAPGPREAIEMSRNHAGDIHLLLTDLVMPHMNGRKLAEAITAERPSTAVIYVSGYTENTIVHFGEVDQGVNFLPKPITVNRLLEAVARVLGEASR